MADNTTLNVMSGGDTYASDDIGGVKFPRSKLIHGVDGVNDGDVALTNPLPVRVPSGVFLSAPSGFVVSVPSAIALFTPSGVRAEIPSGLTANMPSGVRAVLYGSSGAALSHQNPLAVSIPSGITGRVEIPSGVSVALPSGLALSVAGSPVSTSNPLPAQIPSGLFVGITASGLPITSGNPLPVSFSAGANPSGTAVQGLEAHDSPLAANPIPVGGYASAAAPSDVADGDVTRAWFARNGALHVGLQSAGTLIAAGVGAAANALRTAPAADVVWPISQATGAPFTAWSRQATGTVHAITQASGAVLSTWSRQATGTIDTVAFPTGSMPVVKVESEEVHGFTPTGGPFLVGFQGRGADPASVASGAVTQAYADTQGKQVVMVGAPISLRLRGVAGVQGTGARTVIAAQGSGFSIAVTALSAMNASPSFASRVVLHDGSATLFGGYASAGGGGFTQNGGGYPLFVAAPNSALQAVALATGADIDVTISGYKVSNP